MILLLWNIVLVDSEILHTKVRMSNSKCDINRNVW